MFKFMTVVSEDQTFLAIFKNLPLVSDLEQSKKDGPWKKPQLDGQIRVKFGVFASKHTALKQA
jgi:hypothetical protein